MKKPEAKEMLMKKLMNDLRERLSDLSKKDCLPKGCVADQINEALIYENEKILVKCQQYILTTLPTDDDSAGDKNSVEYLQNEIKELQSIVCENLPDDCVGGYSEVKFCNYRNGFGNKCKHCIDF